MNDNLLSQILILIFSIFLIFLTFFSWKAIDWLSNVNSVGFAVMQILIFIKSSHLQIIMEENSYSKDLPQSLAHLVVIKWHACIKL